MELHEPFLRYESGKTMIFEWFPLRDFFNEIKPIANAVKPPTDVQLEINRFHEIAEQSGKAFLDLDDDNLYWYVFRNWELNGRQSIFDFSKIFSQAKENSVTIFPRKKGGSFTPNNGDAWNYQEIAEAVAPYFDHVYITGHPSMSEEIRETGNIHLRLSTNNEEIIKSCLASKLIITQHSGAVHLGAYTQSDVLVIFNGNPPIKGMGDTLRFRKNISNRPLNFAFSKEEIIQFAINYVK
jgi:ADP-heptose:LPS heptosyltransferase